MLNIAAHRSFLFFCLIGVLNTTLYSSLMIAFVEAVEISPTTSAATAFVVANIFSYVMNSRFSFQQRTTRSGYARFLGVSLLNLAITVAITYACEVLGFHYLIGLVGVVLTSTVLTFLLHRRFSFKR